MAGMPLKPRQTLERAPSDRGVPCPRVDSAPAHLVQHDRQQHLQQPRVEQRPEEAPKVQAQAGAALQPGEAAAGWAPVCAARRSGATAAREPPKLPDTPVEHTTSVRPGLGALLASARQPTLGISITPASQAWNRASPPSAHLRKALVARFRPCSQRGRHGNQAAWTQALPPRAGGALGS